jgi:hypothetical protein
MSLSHGPKDLLEMSTSKLGLFSYCCKERRLLTVLALMYILDLSIMLIEIILTLVMYIALFPSVKKNIAYLLVYPAPFIPFILAQGSQ